MEYKGFKMKHELMLKELESVAKQQNIQVTYESISEKVGLGGLCRVRGEYRIIIDKQSAVADRIAMLAQALSTLDIQTNTVSEPVSQMIRYYSS